MSATKFKVESLPFKSKKAPKQIPYPLPSLDNISWVCLGRRGSGKTTVICNLVRAYAKSTETIVVLSPTIHLDKNWESISFLKNVMVSSVCDNQILAEIIDTQVEAYDFNKPNENRLLLVIDDFGNSFKRREMRKEINKIFTLFRHYGGALICGIQSIAHLEGLQITNTMQWLFWDTNKKALKKTCQDIATANMDEDQLQDFIVKNTKNPYSFVFIDYTKPPEEQFRIGFDTIYNPPSKD